jgi:hypothetical protein
MGQPNALSTHSFVEAPQRMAPSPLDAPATSTAADRLYQVAALAAGFFLLASLL